MKRAIERRVVYPLANLLATEQVHLGDLICVDWNRDQQCLTFVREQVNITIGAHRSDPAIMARDNKCLKASA